MAAVICLLAAVSTAAVAADWFGLRELLLPRQQVTMPVDPETGAVFRELADRAQKQCALIAELMGML